jgi:hypothetical protein
LCSGASGGNAATCAVGIVYNPGPHLFIPISELHIVIKISALTAADREAECAEL